MASDSFTLRAQTIFDAHRDSIYQRTDQLFGVLLVLQWVLNIAAAFFLTPYTWAGTEQSLNPHLVASIVICTTAVTFPLYMIARHSGSALTRHSIAVAIMVLVGMLVHMTGGRIETHFNYFGTLAFIGLYRDWRVLLTATVVAALDHFLRSVYWPYSIFGVLTANPWRWLEHVGWVIYEVGVLLIAMNQGVREMRTIATRQSDMEEAQAAVERQVEALRVEIEERKRAEERILVTTEELRRSNKELESFASIASHDLQEPLRKVQAFSDRLRRKLGDDLPPGADDDMQRIQNAAARMQQLIDDLLVYSRVMTKAKPFVSVDLSTVVAELLEDLEVQISSSSAKLSVEPLPTVMAEPTQMRQLFQNLLGNALKYRNVDIPPEISVRITEHEDPQFYQIEVRDNGIGFEDQYQERIFGIFQRLHDQKKYKGTGIGLAVCRKIVERHGGTIRALSPGDGQGAMFQIALLKNMDAKEPAN